LQGRGEEQGFAGPNKERMTMPHPVPRDVVAQMVAYLLVQMLVLLLAQMVVLPGPTGGAFGVCFFNSTDQGIDEMRCCAAPISAPSATEPPASTRPSQTIGCFGAKGHWPKH
jgi:hypothetical protein